MSVGRFFIRAIGGMVALGVLALVLIPVLGMLAIALGLGILLLKVALFAMVLSWLFRKLFGGGRKHEPVLVGAPVMDVAAPQRDKYDIAAERELDEELGI